MADQKSESFFVRSWYQKSPFMLLLLPLSVLYWLISGVRHYFYRQGIFSSFKAAVPVIVVGNITVGGTGKTPVVIALVEALRAAGFNPGVVSRGYGSKAPRYPYKVESVDTPTHCGDEPLLIALRTHAPVVIDGNRQQAITALLDEYACDVIISDDGLQHYALQRDIEIAVVDGQRGFGNGFLLPAGPLRETVDRLNCVDYVVSNGAATAVDLPHNYYEMNLQATGFHALQGQEFVASTGWQLDKNINAVAGIGNPQRFYNSLKQLGLDPIEYSFADHHDYCSEDFQFDNNLPVVMTEKDAVKARFITVPNSSWFLSIDAHIPEEFYASIVSQLKAMK